MIDRVTLLGDGSSDRALLPVLTWLLAETLPTHPIIPQWADLTALARPPKDLPGRLRAAVDLFPCDVLFVHRDAEKVAYGERRAEVMAAAKRAFPDGKPCIAVIPVRMTEAWLMFNEAAVRRAAGNPNGTVPLQLPTLRDVERVADPKASLLALLLDATELSRRRLKNFNAYDAVRRLADLIEDFSPLRTLPAFRQLEADLVTLIHHYRG